MGYKYYLLENKRLFEATKVIHKESDFLNNIWTTEAFMIGKQIDRKRVVGILSKIDNVQQIAPLYDENTKKIYSHGKIIQIKDDNANKFK